MPNSFKELYKDEEPSQEVKKKVMGNQKQIRHIASYFELFLGNFFRSITSLIEVANSKPKDKTDESENHSNKE